MTLHAYVGLQQARTSNRKVWAVPNVWQRLAGLVSKQETTTQRAMSDALANSKCEGYC